MDVTEKWGDDVDSAVELALAELKLTKDEVDITVLEEPSRGFFGIGSRLALVRVEKKKTESVKEESSISEKSNSEKTSKDDKYEAVGIFKRKNNESSKVETVKTSKKDNKLSAETAEIKTDIPGENKKILDFYADIEPLPICEDHIAKEFLNEVLEQMGLDLKLTVKADEKNVYIKIEGEDSGTIIGKRGQTLDAIQYLTSLVVNKDRQDHVKVVVDAENYRSRREETLKKLAKRLADKVVRTARPVKLEPMNPYERKVIHSTLQDNPEVLTRSEGEDPYRRIIIELK